MVKSPDAFRTISEVSEWLDTPAHVLRFWESKFTQIRPVKRAGGRRYYRPEDMALLGGIKMLLHEQGMTIKGVQKLLREQGIRHVAALGPGPLDGIDLPGPGVDDSDGQAAAMPSLAPLSPAAAAPPPRPAHAAPPLMPQPAPAPRAAPAPTLPAHAWPQDRVGAQDGVGPQDGVRPMPADVALPPPAAGAPGLLSAILACEPGSLARRSARIAPVAARLGALRDRLRAAR